MQWLGDGFNLYKVEGFELRESAIASLFGLTRKQFEKCNICEKDVDREIYRDESYDGASDQLYHVGNVWYNEQVLMALRSSEGLLFLPQPSMGPVNYTDGTDFRLRRQDGLQLIAVYNGLFCDALLLAVDTITAENVVEQMERITAIPLRQGMAGDSEEVSA